MNNKQIQMYSSQTNEVIDIINKDGFAFVKMDFIKKKYQDTAWIFETVYKAFYNMARERLPLKEGAESYFWMFKDEKWAKPGEGSKQLKLKIPENEIILFDLRDYNRMLNLEYLGSRQECEEFEAYLRKQGIDSGYTVFKKPFYPMIKSKIVKSWDKLFLKEEFEEEYIQGATGVIKREWIENIAKNS